MSVTGVACLGHMMVDVIRKCLDQTQWVDHRLQARTTHVAEVTSIQVMSLHGEIGQMMADAEAVHEIPAAQKSSTTEVLLGARTSEEI